MAAENFQCFVADVVFNAFGVNFGCLGGDAQRLQEIDHDAVPVAGHFSNLSPAIGKENRPVWLRRYIPVALQAGDGLDHRHMRNTQSPRNIHRAGFTGGVDQIGDHFQIVLGDGRAAVGARLPMDARLRFDAAQRGVGLACSPLGRSGTRGFLLHAGRI